MKKVDCKYIDKKGYCNHPDLVCIQECGIILDNNCKLQEEKTLNKVDMKMERRKDNLLPYHCESCLRIEYLRYDLYCSLYHMFVYGKICRGYMDRDIYWENPLVIRKNLTVG